MLLADLDPQAAASFLFRVRPRVKGGGAALIRGSRDLDKAIKGTDFDGLDLLPADFTFRNLDLILDTTKKPTQRLARLLRPLRTSYDLVFLDCPPGHLAAVRGVLHAADLVLAPIIPTTLSLRTLDQLTEFIERLRRAPARAARVLLDDRPPQAAAQGDRGAAADRADGCRGHGHPCAVDDRADGRGDDHRSTAFAPRSAAARAYAVPLGRGT